MSAYGSINNGRMERLKWVSERNQHVPLSELAYMLDLGEESVPGTAIMNVVDTGLYEICGGRSGAYEKELAKAREIAFDELQQRASELGANAVIGIDIDYKVIGKDGRMLMVSVSGTAVTLS